MVTPVKYSASQVDNTFKVGNIVFGTGTVDYGPTSSTGFYAGIEPPASGYTIYFVGESNKINARCANNDTELLSIAKEYGGSSIETVTDAINYFVTGSTGTTIANTNFPNIITSGLTFYVDAGLIFSYPKSGNKWYDLSGNDRTVTKTVEDFYSLGYFVFSGNSTMTHSDIIISSGSSYTISQWQYLPLDVGGWNAFCGYNLGDGGYWMHHTGNSPAFYHGYYNSTAYITYMSNTHPPIGEWFNITITYNGDINEVTTYINAEYKESKPIYWSTQPDSGYIKLIRLGAGGSTRYFSGSISTYSVYNRVLSQTEITHNFNTIKSRFGL